ncbi:argininosuccinate synthase [Thermoplasma volcanium GSS1]|nr:argininosuccinate synthase [Thermoplasma volcanium GSS1]
MAKKAVELAEKHGFEAIAHGSTGRGNDQVRFELGIKALNPSLEMLAPVRDWNMLRSEEIEYAKKNNIIVPSDGKYSVDENLWGRSIEGSEIENMSLPVPEDAYEWLVPPWEAGPGEVIKLEFSNGLPVAINDSDFELQNLIANLNIIGGRNSIGLIDHVEDRITGIKSREVYECPAAEIITYAHGYLESLILNKHEISIKSFLDSKFSQFVYNGLWYDPAMKPLIAGEEILNSEINGSISLKLYKGKIYFNGSKGANFSYNSNVANYSTYEFDQKSSKGFIDIFKNDTVYSILARQKAKEEALS